MSEYLCWALAAIIIGSVIASKCPIYLFRLSEVVNSCIILQIIEVLELIRSIGYMQRYNHITVCCASYSSYTIFKFLCDYQTISITNFNFSTWRTSHTFRINRPETLVIDCNGFIRSFSCYQSRHGKRVDEAYICLQHEYERHRPQCSILIFSAFS